MLRVEVGEKAVADSSVVTSSGQRALKRARTAADCPAQATEFLVDDQQRTGLFGDALRGPLPRRGDDARNQLQPFRRPRPQHRGLLRLEHGTGTRTAIFGPERATQSFELAKISALTQFVDYGREGVWHIWTAFDHILFLLSLLLPRCSCSKGRWRAVAPVSAGVLGKSSRSSRRSPWRNSITLSLAALGSDLAALAGWWNRRSRPRCARRAQQRVSPRARTALDGRFSPSG